MNNSPLFIAIALLAFSIKSIAQSPNWFINPADYNNTMTFSAHVLLDGNQVNSGAYVLGAFVGE